ncbi:HemK2/MTQ2 family protein methyltransferase [Streptacidiphilus carbonis]|uniref:HemK2/MTQ2 family protein methyltransferase n=1 Tax=Streptacidiphilus carbonis TaxID=105422 RepID=UPI0005AA3779|nr:HemK2/MTQ2 family protein methyltransferase [Streptacidiphilus carbonis]
MFLVRTPGVYRAQGDTALLIESLRHEPMGPGRSVLDIGTGSGAVALAAACRGSSVTAVDVSWRALATTLVNGALHGRWIAVRRGDLVAPVAGRAFDVVVSNPPYVPASATRLPSRGVARAWDAGPDGRVLLDRICREAPRVLRVGGVLLMVQSSLCGVSTTCLALADSGMRAQVVARRRQRFGPVMRSRAGWFEERGIIAPGQREEELVVIRAVRT